jgi:hypothetical protein
MLSRVEEVGRVNLERPIDLFINFQDVRGICDKIKS